MSADFWMGVCAGALVASALIVGTGVAAHIAALRQLAADRAMPSRGVPDAERAASEEDKVKRRQEEVLKWRQEEALVRWAADSFDSGRRDFLNALLAPNPAAAAKLAALSGRDADPEGRLPFDVVFWVAEVADQLGIRSLEEMAEAHGHG